MGMDDLVMHAVLMKANSSATRKGTKTYKIAFTYPPGFHAIIGDIVGTEADVYWNEVLIANSAFVSGASVKGVKNEDSEYILTMEAQPQDTALANLAHEVNDTGDLRLHALQMALGLKD